MKNNMKMANIILITVFVLLFLLVYFTTHFFFIILSLAIQAIVYFILMNWVRKDNENDENIDI